LDHAHSLQSPSGPLGIVHRDISPSNLMLSFHGDVKILDFGIARATEEVRESKTQAGTMKGKISYMSPEQVRMEDIDNRSDIFAVGIVLHELLTGRRLFKSTNEFNSAKLVLESVVPLPSSVNPEVPASVDPIVMRALDRNVNERYQTAGQMAEDLDKALFEMRAPPGGPRKLLVSLFPQVLTRTGEVHLNFTPTPPGDGNAIPSPAAMGLSSKVTTALPGGALEVDLGDLAPAGRGRRGVRRWLGLGFVAGAIVAVVMLVQGPRKAPAPEVSVAPAAAQTAEPALNNADPAPPAAAAKPVVQLSFDSTPQDSRVTREDSGEVVGRTPLTITLPQGSAVISFKVEKDGFAPAIYKVIPDLAKAVHVELVAEAPTVPKQPLAPHRAAPPARTRPTAVAHAARPATETAAAPEGPRDCILSVASFPWADLWIDGKDTGQRTPVVHYPVSCGAHKLSLKRRDLRVDHVEQVTVAPGHELKQHYELGDDYGE
jgi:serine/threonine-protein kinase